MLSRVQESVVVTCDWCSAPPEPGLPASPPPPDSTRPPPTTAGGSQASRSAARSGPTPTPSAPPPPGTPPPLAGAPARSCQAGGPPPPPSSTAPACGGASDRCKHARKGGMRGSCGAGASAQARGEQIAQTGEPPPGWCRRAAGAQLHTTAS